jgi:alpha-L-arabinofuranosidase
MAGRAAITLLSALFSLAFLASAFAQTTTLTIQAGSPGKPISKDLFGIFFEDLNYAADGGLYAELVQNRSFEYSRADNKNFTPLTAWELVQRGGGRGDVNVETGSPLNENNSHYAVLTVTSVGQTGLQNNGYDGIPLTAGELYDFSIFARQLEGAGGPLTVRLESRSGDLLGEAALAKPTGEWKKYGATIKAARTDADGRLVVLAGGTGKLALDMISLFPHKTFHNRPNGLRADLAQSIAGLHPKFVRFPGGCLVHGDGLANMYRWKNTIGPVEQRKGQPNIWHYHQSVGLGYYEYFQFCEDIGAKPLPIVPAGVCCQNSGASVTGKWGLGQKGLPMSEMPSYVQEVLDLIEYANGPADLTWGAKRAAAGHPRPFGLEYLGIGNEEHITPVFKERFAMVYAAVKAKHPEITVIGTVGPFHDGDDYDWGWSIADELKLPMVDEHYYEKPEWFLANLNRYDTYDRARSKVYLGEYAAHDAKKQPTLRSALAEAAYMTSLERNGDVVRMASYAPLLGRLGHTQWDPDLIYFTNTTIHPTISYYVQQMFGRNSGDAYLPGTLDGPKRAGDFAFSAVRNGKSGDLILKLVNTGSAARSLHVELAGAKRLALEAERTVLTGPPTAINSARGGSPLVPKTETITAAPVFEYEMPANSLAVFRFHFKSSR